MIIFLLSIWSYVGLEASACPGSSLVEYEIYFETHWDRRDFPKHYPEWRPPASWSKLIGYSHNSSFLLFRKGKEASLPFQLFVESGNTDRLDLKTQGSFGVHDAFAAVPIPTGVGQSRVKFTANGNHTKISFASKINPSPDWFVGLDSYDLCPHGRWMEYIHMQGEPMDAGTDSGLTFTSPNWQSDPLEPIQEITNRFPQHPAGSFYYPEIDYLPLISQFTITKIHEYSIKEKFDAADYSGHLYNKVDLNRKNNGIKDKTSVKHPSYIRKQTIDRKKNQVTYSSSENAFPVEEQVIMKIITNDGFSSFETNEINSNKLQNNYKSKIQESATNTNNKLPQTNDIIVDTILANNVSVQDDLVSRRIRYRPRQRLNDVKHKKKIPTGDAMAVIDNIVRKYQKEHRRQLKKRRREGRKRRKNHPKKIRPPRDCRVSDWSDWAGCSKTCGIGEKSRKREMVQRARRGGKPCPSLKETTWCGSARACSRHYFNWSF